MPILIVVASLVVILLAIRTLCWHLQSWQLREYRFDRMRARLRTKEGKRDLWNLWFFRGVLPRPKVTGRVGLIVGLVLLFVGLDAWFGYLWWTGNPPAFAFASATPFAKGGEIWIPLTLLLFERFIWLYVLVAVWVSQLPYGIAKRRLFRRAKAIIDQSDENIIRIGITGSYGKSSTKEILVHLLIQAFGEERVLFTPKNHNHEIALARLIKNSEKFFTRKKKEQKAEQSNLESRTSNLEPRFAVFEMGAYRRGDIKGMCDFVQPHVGILTAIGVQHLDLFGSQENILRGKLELAEGSSERVIFNADNEALQETLGGMNKEQGTGKKEKKNLDLHPRAGGDPHKKMDSCLRRNDGKPILTAPISQSLATHVNPAIDHTKFQAWREEFTLPWPGEFFVTNALLALECVRQCGVSEADLASYLSTLPPLERALKVRTLDTGATVLEDLYSSNPAGVKAAIDHLGKANGRKVFVGIPLLELGEKSLGIHEQIFSSLKKIDAEVFWLKDDFAALGQDICGDRFRGNDQVALESLAGELLASDMVLLEGRLSETVVGWFSELRDKN